MCCEGYVDDTLWSNCFLSKYRPYTIWKPNENNKLLGDFSSKNVQEREKTQREMEKRGQQKIDSGCLSKSIYRQEVKNTEKDLWCVTKTKCLWL